MPPHPADERAQVSPTMRIAAAVSAVRSSNFARHTSHSQAVAPRSQQWRRRRREWDALTARTTSRPRPRPPPPLDWPRGAARGAWRWRRRSSSGRRRWVASGSSPPPVAPGAEMIRLPRGFPVWRRGGRAGPAAVVVAAGSLAAERDRAVPVPAAAAGRGVGLGALDSDAAGAARRRQRVLG